MIVVIFRDNKNLPEENVHYYIHMITYHAKGDYIVNYFNQPIVS